MKFAFFTRHQTLGASTRYRSLQHFDLLRTKGHEVTQYPFFTDRYLRARSNGQWPLAEITRCYLSRLQASLFSARDSDVIFIEKELFPYLPAASEKLLRTTSKIRVYDYDDAIWHSYEKRKFGPFGAVYSNKIEKVVRYGTNTIAGSRYLKRQLDAWDTKDAALIPTTVSAERYNGQGLFAEKEVDIVWIGSMTTGIHVQRIFPVLKRLHETRGSKTRLIGFSRSLLTGDIPDFVDLQPWSSQTELELLAASRIGIMPLPDEPFEKGKCGFKLAQYMGIGLPAVASPIGENKYIIRNGETGYLANTDEDWFTKLSALLDSPTKAQRMGRRSYDRFRDSYCTEVIHQLLRQEIFGAAQTVATPKRPI